MGNKDVSKKKKIPTQKVADDFEGFFFGRLGNISR